MINDDLEEFRNIKEINNLIEEGKLIEINIDE